MIDKRAGRAPSQRQLRVGEEVRHALADILRRGDFRDPEIQKLNITVTEVRVSPDLRNATAFITPLGGGNAADAVATLRRATTFFRAQIARAINLRYAPNIAFEADTSFDYAQRIDSLLHDPDVARDLATRDEGEDPDDEDEDLDVEYEDDEDEDLDDDEEDEDEDDIEYEDDEDEDEDDEDGGGYRHKASGGAGRRGA